jgi:hypothetical protein
VAGVRTLVTEIATGLGMLGWPDVDANTAMPIELRGLDEATWQRFLQAARTTLRVDATAALYNGLAFRRSPEGLGEQRPRLVEWTGGRRQMGDESVPTDLRVNHVYLVSCKYLSRVLHNRSPAQLVDALLAPGASVDETDWYRRVAPVEYDDLYRAVRSYLPVAQLPEHQSDLTGQQRRSLATALKGPWQGALASRYAELCTAVASATADRWRAGITSRADGERMLWRLLRIGPAPYFVLGSDGKASVRIRVGTPWDWRQRFSFRSLEISPQAGGQPRVAWTAAVGDMMSGTDRVVVGHVEVRWSHGRFRQPPEAKVYLDTPTANVPGYSAI